MRFAQFVRSSWLLVQYLEKTETLWQVFLKIRPVLQNFSQKIFYFCSTKLEMEIWLEKSKLFRNEYIETKNFRSGLRARDASIIATDLHFESTELRSKSTLRATRFCNEPLAGKQTVCAPKLVHKFKNRYLRRQFNCAISLVQHRKIRNGCAVKHEYSLILCKNL